MNPSLPLLYGLPKIHKDHVLSRPMVSYVTATTHQLCKFLNKWFKCNTNFRPRYSLKKTFDLINRLKDIEIPKKLNFVIFLRHQFIY